MPTYGQSPTRVIANTGAVFGAITSAVNSASNLSSAINGAQNIASLIRSINLPAGGELVGDIVSAISMFSEQADPNDWRVRLSIPYWVSFANSPVLKPLRDAGGLIFPYTPKISLQYTSSYDQQTLTHSNYMSHSYKNGSINPMNITAPMPVEDANQALYWIATLHYLRSVTKMFTGNDPKAGNPPPVVFLNGYGNYVLKNVPVVVTNFSVDLDSECDYISTEVVGSAAANIGNIADTIDSIAELVGTGIPGLGTFGNLIGGLANNVSQITGILGSYNVGGNVSGGIVHVPTRSTFTVTVQPIYSRDSMRRFSLDRFVAGGYLDNYFGYI